MARSKTTVTLISHIIEVQFNIQPRGRSTAQVTVLTSDGETHPFSLNLTPEQIESVKAMAGDMLRVKANEGG